MLERLTSHTFSAKCCVLFKICIVQIFYQKFSFWQWQFQVHRDHGTLPRFLPASYRHRRSMAHSTRCRMASSRPSRRPTFTLAQKFKKLFGYFSSNITKLATKVFNSGTPKNTFDGKNFVLKFYEFLLQSCSRAFERCTHHYT